MARRIKALIVLCMVIYYCPAHSQSIENLTQTGILDSLKRSPKADHLRNIYWLKAYKEKCTGKDNLECQSDSIDRLTADTYYAIARSKLSINVDTTRKYNDLAKQLFAKTGNTKEVYDCIFTEASVEYSNGTYKKALALIEECINYQQSVPGKNDLARVLHKQAAIFRRMGFQDTAIVITHKTIRLLEENPQDELLANCYQTMGLAYTDIGQYEDALTYFTLSKDIHTKIGSLSGQAALITSIGNVVYILGDTLGCIPYYRQAGDLNAKVGNLEGTYVNYFNIGNAYFQISVYDSSRVYLNKAKQFQKELGARKQYMVNYLGGALNVKTNQPKKGVQMLESAYQTSLGRSAYIDARDISAYIAEGYATLGDYNKAYEYQIIHSQLKDSVVTVATTSKINELKTQYETEKKELTIQNLELTTSKQKQRIIGGGIALGLISLLSFFLFNLYKKVNTQKSVISKALSEKDILLREIHHRVKNNLQLISSLLTLQSRSIDDETALQAINEGKSRVRSMALIHQDLYNKENLTGISIKEYIEKLTHELFATYRIDKDRLVLTTEIEDLELDVDTLVPLGLIINELLTNSLKYAFGENQEGNILVVLKEENERLLLRVKDDGIGYDPSQVREQSFGSTLITALTAQLEGQATLDSTQGTDYTISFKDYKRL